MKRIMALGVCLVGLLGVMALAGSIRVAPGAFCVQEIEIGREIDLGLDLVITNSGTEEREFTVRTVKPSRAKKKWLKGYAEIPDPSWFKFKSDRIRVAPFQEGHLRMRLAIPKNEAYYNQRWLVYAEVAGDTKKGQMFSLMVKPNYMIETRSKTEVKPYGPFGLAPSNVAVKVKPGVKGRAVFKLFNNDQVARTFKVYTYITKPSPQKQDINLTPGYEQIGDPAWVRPVLGKVKVLSGGKSADVELAIKVPEYARARRKGWEAIVMVELEQGLASFARVYLNK